jgi:hypothetical protein
MKRLEQFIMSFRWIGFSGDIKNGELQDGEYWQCPNRGIALTKEYFASYPLTTIKDY